MANGFSLGVLQTIRDITKQAAPQDKLEPVGMLGSLKIAHSPGIIMNDSGAGHTKTVTVKHKKRFTPAQTSTVDSCETTNTQPYFENTVSVANYRQIAIHLEDVVVAQYDEYASAMQSGGTIPLTPMMWELYDHIKSAASALNQAVNEDVLTLALAAMGVNRTTGVNTATTLNIPLNTVNNPLGDSINQMLYDFQFNSFTGRPIVVGSGMLHKWMLQQNAKSADQAGLSSRIQAAGLDFWVDNILGTVEADADAIAVYEKDSIQLVEWLRNRGAFAGTKGTSTFGVIGLPMDAGNGTTQTMMYDYQLKYNDCAEEFGYVDGVEAVTLQRGWNMIISKHFGLYTIPTNAYRVGDVLAGNRGSLLYTFTNDCVECPA